MFCFSSCLRRLIHGGSASQYCVHADRAVTFNHQHVTGRQFLNVAKERVGAGVVRKVR